jgi:Na+-transporting NADH:ubiquinone oxidoreductase subunit C
MSKTSKIRERFATVAFMFVITFVFISVVSALYLSTQDRVRLNESLYLRRAVMEAAGVDDAYALAPADVARWYEQHVRQRSLKVSGGNPLPVYVMVDPGTGAMQGVAVVRVANGLWGKILSVVGLNDTMESLTGVAFVSHNETPGLGARIAEGWFRRQFRGKTGPFVLVPEGSRSASPRDMDAITGATVTSAGIRDMLNRTLKEIPEVVRRDALWAASPPGRNGAVRQEPQQR